MLYDDAKKHLIRLSNVEFSEIKIKVHFKHIEKELQRNEEDVKQGVAEFIKKINRYREKHNLDLIKLGGLNYE